MPASKWTAETRQAILDVLSQGKTVRAACASAGVSEKTYWGWLKTAERLKARQTSGEALTPHEQTFVDYYDRINNPLSGGRAGQRRITDSEVREEMELALGLPADALIKADGKAYWGDHYWREGVRQAAAGGRPGSLYPDLPDARGRGVDREAQVMRNRRIRAEHEAGVSIQGIASTYRLTERRVRQIIASGEIPPEQALLQRLANGGSLLPEESEELAVLRFGNRPVAEQERLARERDEAARTKLTPQLAKAISDAIESGNTPATIAAAAGVSEETLDWWLEEGRSLGPAYREAQ